MKDYSPRTINRLVYARPYRPGPDWLTIIAAVVMALTAIAVVCIIIAQ